MRTQTEDPGKDAICTPGTEASKKPACRHLALRLLPPRILGKPISVVDAAHSVSVNTARAKEGEERKPEADWLVGQTESVG